MENKADIRNMLKDALILFAITLLSGLMLGFVYEVTKEPIRLQEEKAIQEACRAVFETAEQFEKLEYTPGDKMTAELSEMGVYAGSVYQAKSSTGEHLGYVAEMTSQEGYGGNITLYVGVTDDGSLNGISILSIAETPGLGMRAEEVLVPQFANKKEESFTYTKSGSTSEREIDAISGATVTTKAVTNAVNGGLKVILTDLLPMNGNDVKEGGQSNE